MSLASIDFVVYALPPQHDAIGEYSTYFAHELAKFRDTRILTVEGDFSAVENVPIHSCFRLKQPRGFTGLTKEIERSEADVLLLQYNPFGWGRRGYAWPMIKALSMGLTRSPKRLIVMAHETYVPAVSWKFRVMRLWQRPQFNALMRLADVMFIAVEAWAKKERGRQRCRVEHMPVGANLPFANAPRSDFRQRLGIQDNQVVCGVFGGAHPSRLLGQVGRSIKAARASMKSANDLVVLHVGSQADAVRHSLQIDDMFSTGWLEPQSAANAIAACDIMLNPFVDGISTRRGSAMAAIQQGVPLLTTRGCNTDSVWHTKGSGVFMTEATDERAWIKLVTEICQNRMLLSSARTDAARFYRQNFDWPVLVQQTLTLADL